MGKMKWEEGREDEGGSSFFALGRKRKLGASVSYSVCQRKHCVIITCRPTLHVDL